MSGAFRFQPAVGRLDRLIHRPRLVRLLHARFEKRLTVVVAPAGAGKSTTLALVIESNRIDPMGQDLWLGIEPGDNNPDQLLAGLCRSAGVEVESGMKPTLETVIDAIWRRAPQEVVLLLDDLHLITNGGSLQVVSDLIAALPLNGHVLLSSRTSPKIPMARIQAHGELATIDFDQLQFDDVELNVLAALRPESDVEVGDLSHHPALADLRLVAGPGGQANYLEEEVLGALDTDQMTVLRKLSILPDFDEEVALAVSDGQFGAEGLVGDLPLVDQTADGRFRLHALLRDVLRRHVTPAVAAEVNLIAARIEEGRGNTPEAILLSAKGGDRQRGAELSRRLVAMPGLGWNYEQMASVRQFLQQDMNGSALAALFETRYQLTEHEREMVAAESTDILLAIADQARDEDDQTVEAVAIFRIIEMHDVEGVNITEALVRRLEGIEGSGPVGKALLRQVKIAEATKRGETKEALRLINADPDPDPAIEAVYLAVRLCDLGLPEDVGVGMTPANLGGITGGSEVMVAFALWLRGDVAPETALIIASDMVLKMLPRRMSGNSVSLLGVGIFVALAAGENKTAIQFLSRGDTIVELGGTNQSRQFMAIGRAALASVLDSDEEAARILEECFQDFPLRSWPSRHLLLGLCFVYVTCPDTRQMLAGCDFGRSLAVSVRAGQALVTMRETGSAAEAAALPWSEPSLLRAQILPHHLCELAIGAMAAGEPSAREVYGQLPNLAKLLERVGQTATELVQSAAKRQLRRFPAKPTSDIRIVTLGVMELWRDGELVQDDDWVRRKRVRELLAFVVEKRSASRGEVMAALWPDLDEAKASSNLRVNLSHLQRVLEPDRTTAAPFYVQVEGERLILEAETRVDADEFERKMTDALDHDRAGVTSVAYQLYLEALELYRGPFLADFDAAWCEDNRVRFDSLHLGGCCRVGELTAARGEPEEALEWAIRALRTSELSERAGRLFASCLFAMQDRPAAHQSLVSLLARLHEAELTPEPETERLLVRFSE